MSLVKKSEFVQGVHGLRAVAAVFVVTYHAAGAIAAPKYQGLDWPANAASGLSAGVSIFFVISGFVISLPFFRGKRMPLPVYLGNRLLRVYPLSMGTALLFMLGAWSVSGAVPSIEELVASLLLVPTNADPVPIVLWTLQQEMLFYLLFAFVYLRPLPAFCGLAVWGALSVAAPAPTAMLGWLFNAHNVECCYGIMAAWAYQHRPIVPKTAFPLGAFAALLFLASGYYLKNSQHGEGVNSACLGAIAGVLVYSVAAMRISLPRTMLFLADATYSVYLIHFLFISLVNKFLVQMFPAMPGLAALLILVISSALGGCGYYLLLERRLETWRKRVMARPVRRSPVPLAEGAG